MSSRFDGSRIFTPLAILILVLGVCSGVYGWYKYRSVPAIRSASSVPAQAQKVPKPIAVPISVPSTPPANETSEQVAAPPPEPAPERRVLLDLMAREETWLSVSSDGKPVFSGILAPNQSKTVEGKEYAKMRVGNAAGIEVRLNGRPLGQLGHRGQVLVVVFTPDNFQIVFPAKESD